jgi:hypothetical protein
VQEALKEDVARSIPQESKDMSCAIVQSNYIPWKGYFDLINSVDEFVLFDCVQYTRRDWRNRNRIKTAREVVWLSVPVQSKGNYEAPIDGILVSDPNWAEQHWETIRHSYAKAPFFDYFADRIKGCYEKAASKPRLSEINRLFIDAVCSILGIQTRITDSRQYALNEDRNLRLAGICRQLGATRYLSGPAAKGYLDESLFLAHGAKVEWMSYDHYPEYAQTTLPFEHSVSILDLLFNTGPDARQYMKSFSRTS